MSTAMSFAFVSRRIIPVERGFIATSKRFLAAGKRRQKFVEKNLQKRLAPKKKKLTPPVEPGEGGLGWRAIFLLGIAPIAAWAITIAIRPELREQMDLVARDLLGLPAKPSDASDASKEA